jgi:hypothetical protein
MTIVGPDRGTGIGRFAPIVSGEMVIEVAVQEARHRMGRVKTWVGTYREKFRRQAEFGTAPEDRTARARYARKMLEIVDQVYAVARWVARELGDVEVRTADELLAEDAVDVDAHRLEELGELRWAT